MKLVLAFAVALSVVGVAHAQQLKSVPVNSYVLTEPDGTPRYLVQNAEESKSRKVYRVTPVEQEESSTPQRGKRNGRRGTEKRFIWPNEWM